MTLKKKTSDSNINQPQFWDNKYIINKAKWDIGQPTPAFVEYFRSLKNKNKKILIPGCGSGHDAIFLADLGFDVYALDFSEEAINILLQKRKRNNTFLHALNTDFFNLNEFDSAFDIVLEYTFFCAILPDKRLDYIKQVHRLLKKNGKYIGFLLPVNKDVNEEGPPYGVNIDETINNFSKYFSIIECCQSKHSIEPRKETEIFVRMTNVKK